MKKIKAIIPLYAVTNEDAMDLGKKFQNVYLENAKNVIFSTLHIEDILGRGIGRYFFGEEPKKRKIFDDLIISTDSFSFSSKRKAFFSILSEQGILKGQEKSSFEKLIASIIRYRNMFTHGTPLFTNVGCVLHYFEGRKVEKLITDEFLEKVEADLSECFHKTEKAMLKIEIVT